MNKSLLYAIPLAVLALVAGIWLAQTRYAPQAPALPVAVLWQLTYPDTQGRPQALSQWRGRVLVLNFWASWCAPCREEIPDFVALRTQYTAKGVEFVGIAVDNQANVAQFMQRQAVNYPILIGEGAANNLARQLGNPSGALPYTIVLDREGNIVLKHLGRLPRARLEAVLAKMGAA
ncbi:TlpA disulfide reductase family protein [Thiobacillus sp.]|uniref:TlpA family protein disulfide reductase n=1 Tax=Thiobacillus sp. TaxID=924 RepID=UPI0025F368A1|nr:TlpA disulfide reductase family protein [Thiobacillus sp.]MBT9538959.1 TlpA family protein disulfide reductase [Thiobacillus sp.]